MKAPAAFNSVCSNFVQDFDLVASTPEALIDFARNGLSADDLRKLHVFLADALSGRYSEDELQNLWWATPADIHFRDGKQLAECLALMKARIARLLV
jgi:hypothetical protein